MGEFQPPPGSLDIPHPRTPADILIRTLSIHGFAAVSYAHLVYLLGSRKPHGAATLPLLMVPAFLLLPELLLLQLCFNVIPIVIAHPYRRRVIERFMQLPRELGIVSPNGGRVQLWRLGLHAAFGVFNAFPFAAVVGAYRQRLGMRYHHLTYAANLGLDHRNGWLAISGLVAVLVTECVIAGLAAVVVGGRTGAPAMELPATAARGSEDGRDEAAQQDSTAIGHKWGAGLLARVDWSSVSELVYVSGVHQFILAATNHPVPVLVMVRLWYVWLVVAGAVVYLIGKRKVGKESLIFYASLAFIAATMGSQLGWDFKELWDVHNGHMKQWNFRWQVKDRVSASYEVD